MCGPEFGADAIPGILGTHYTFNSEASFRYFGSKGLSLLRVALLWERLQPVTQGPLDAEYLALLRENVAWAAAANCELILNIQNFGRFRGVITNADDLVDLWVRLSSEFRDEPVVYGYGLMNEPHDLGDADWKSISQQVLTAIRNNNDGKLVLVPGDNWANAALWPSVHGPEGWIADSANNFAYEAHCYFDSDFSGTYQLSYDDEMAQTGAFEEIGVRRVGSFLEWCRNKGVRGYLGEYGVPNNDARWLVVLDKFLTALDEAACDGTYWAAGEWWHDYPLSVQPQGEFDVDRQQTATLLAHLPAEVEAAGPP